MNFWVNIKLYFIVYAKLKINLISIFDEFCLFEQFFWDNNWQISHIKIMRVEKKIKKANKFQFVFVSIASSFVGLINGLLGAGGGSLVVPIYESGMKLEAKKAHATAIATMLPSCIVSGIIYLLGGNFDYLSGGIVSIGVIAGGILGSLLLKVVKNDLLSLVFYFIMIYAGIKLLVWLTTKELNFFVLVVALYIRKCHLLKNLALLIVDSQYKEF